MVKRLSNTLSSILLLSLGVLSASVGLKGFLLPNEFYDGGAMGIALLMSEVWNIELSIGVVLVNIPFLFLGYRHNSYLFLIKTVAAIGVLAIVLKWITYPTFTDDKLLIAFFGGFFLGAGIGLTIRGGGVIDGTEVLAIYLDRNTSLSVGDVIVLINIIIFSIAAWVTHIETALYALLTYFVASKTVDFIIHGIEGYSAMLVISEHHEKVQKLIGEELGHGLSVIKGERGYNPQLLQTQGGQENGQLSSIDIKIIYTVINRLEARRIRNAVEKVDPKAVIIQQRIDDTKGGYVKGRKSQH